MAVVSKEQGSNSEESTGGKTCHQCRQKRNNLVGPCVFIKKDKKKDKRCPMKFCPKCLMNRYGENAEEIASKNDWVCPKCRGICNCSCCRTGQGLKPTGNLAHTAREKGIPGVSKLLEKEGADKYFYKRKVKPEDAVVATPLEPGQENTVKVKRSKKSKREELKDVNNGCDGNDDSVPKTDVAKAPKIPRTKRVRDELKDVSNGCDGNDDPVPKTDVAKVPKILRTKRVREKKEEYWFEEVKLPEGTNSISVSGIDLPSEDAGNILQFMEFCSAFGKALDLRKGQAECVIREMFSGRTSRRQQYSMLTQMMIQLLTVILEDRGKTLISFSATEDSWFTAAGECLSESGVKLDNIPPEMFQQGLAAYEKLDSSQRLKLLNFLCDEALGTMTLRNCIDNVEATERKKEAKEKLNAAKEKEKQLKQKLQDELAKAEAENNGIPLTIQNRYAVASQFNAENEEVRSEMLAAMDMLLKTSQGLDDAVRTKPVEVDDNGHVFWKLNCYNEEPKILLQDLGSWSEGCPKEKWSAFSPEQKLEIEKYIPFIRMKRRRAEKNSKAIPESAILASQ